MQSLWRRTVRLAALVSLASLLLLPLATSRHQHTHPGSRACATCVAAHHSPGVAPTVPLARTVLVASIRSSVAPVLVQARPDRSPHTGRAPPLPPLPTIA
jgi:hypothetical protein